VTVSQATLFCFGAVIFLVAFTGAILYGMSATEQKFMKDTNTKSGNPKAWEVSAGGIVSAKRKVRNR